MALYGMENFAFGTISGTFDASQTTFNLVVTHGARFNTFPAIAVLFNIDPVTGFKTAHDAFVAGDAEVVELVTRVGDVFTVVKRGQDGTSGIVSTPGGIYQISVVASRSQWLKVCRAPPDSSGPFDGILAGTAQTVADAVFRFVKDDGVNACVGSIQGDSAIGRITKLILGDTTDPERLKLETQVSSSPAQVGRLDLEGISFLHLSSDGGLGILKSIGALNDDQVHIGETLTVDKLTGLRETIETIASGVLNINTPFIRVSAEGGPGSDDLDEIILDLADVPFGSRVIVILEPNTTAHNITVRDSFIAGGSANLKLEGGGTFLMQAQGDKIAFISDGVGPSGQDFEEIWRSPPSQGAANYVLIRDEKSSGTDGGTFTSGSWQTRDLNTEVNDTDNLATVGSNQIVLQAGTYRCNITAPGHACLDHKIRLQNITGGTTTLVGSSEFADKSSTSRIRGLFTIGAATTFEVQHQCSSTQSTDGFGVASGFGVVEVYAIAEFRKIG